MFLWDIRLEPEKAAVRTFKGPKVCGDGLDVLGNKCITASLSIDNALQVGATCWEETCCGRTRVNVILISDDYII